MKALKTAIFAATMMSGATAMAAEVSGNVAIGSDYFFRGIDQAGGEALSGGFDVAFENGFYVGTWASSIDFQWWFGTGLLRWLRRFVSLKTLAMTSGYLYLRLPTGPKLLKSSKRFTAAFLSDEL